MARMRVFIVLALALMAGGVFAYGTYNYVQQRGPKGETVTVRTTPVVVAATGPGLLLLREIRDQGLRRQDHRRD